LAQINHEEQDKMRAKSRSEWTIAMITRRRLLVFGLLTTVMAPVLGVWLLWPQSSAIKCENAARIQEGMTLAEVEAMLGGPARDESTRAVIGEGDDLQSIDECRSMLAEATEWAGMAPPLLTWQSNHTMILVKLDHEDRVQGYCFRARIWNCPESPIATLRRWLCL
jgi:hypothetical protein